MELILKDTPVKGEIACAKDNYDSDLFFFARFKEEDVEIARDSKSKYYVIGEGNPVSPIEGLTKDESRHMLKSLGSGLTSGFRHERELTTSILRKLQSDQTTANEQPNREVDYIYDGVTKILQITDGITVKQYAEPNQGYYLCMGFPNQSCEYVFNNIIPDKQYSF